MLWLHQSDEQFYYQPKCALYQRFDGTSPTFITVVNIKSLSWIKCEAINIFQIPAVFIIVLYYALWQHLTVHWVYQLLKYETYPILQYPPNYPKNSAKDEK